MSTGGVVIKSEDGLQKARNGASPRRALKHSDREASHDSTASQGSKIAHTLTACCRCRSRKTKCDAGLPRCGPCDRTGSLCEYFDTTKGRKIPRTYVIHLQNRVKQLELEVSKLEEEQGPTNESEQKVRDPGFVTFEENEEARFIGSSSGLAITRLVFEKAKENMGTSRIREVVPDGHRLEQKLESLNHPGPVQYPLISSVAAPNLPTRNITDKLVDVFSQRAQFLLPTLHEPTLLQDVDDVYSGSADPFKNFVTRLVLAISMQKLDAQYAGLADSYYLAALTYLKEVLKPMDIKTLQSCVLIAQYSLLTPTRTAVYLIVGLAVRLCQQLGLAQEKTIAPPALQLTPLEEDMRRRLSWIVASMEYGLSHILGRPPALSLGDDDLDVKFFATVDDQYISDNGIAKGFPSGKKLIAQHFFRMRLLQAEIRRRLYENKRPEPQNDEHPWFYEMEKRLAVWCAGVPGNDGGSGLDAVWFRARFNTMIIFMYRPSPQVPEVTDKAVTKCYDAAVTNIHIMKRMLDERSTDITWIFVQQVYMLINTTLWAVSYKHIRDAHPRQDVEQHLDTALEMFHSLFTRWPGTKSAFELYQLLIMATLSSYEELAEVLPQQRSSTTSPQVKSEHSYLNRPSRSPPAAPTSPSVDSLSSSYNQASSVSDLAEPSPFGYHFSPGPVDDLPPSLAAHPFDRSPFTSPGFSSGYSQEATDLFGATVSMSQSVPNMQSWSSAQSFSLPPAPMTAQSLQPPPQQHQQHSNMQFQTPESQLPDFGQYLAQNQSVLDSFPFDFTPSGQAQSRLESLNQQQQLDLMESLETEGSQWLDAYLDQSAAFNAALARQYQSYAPG